MFPLYDENRPSRRPYVNYGLIIVNVVVFFFFFLQGVGSLERGIFGWGAVPIDILNGRRLETLFTSMFMHADIFHLGGNMVFLWIFGDNVEDTLGHSKYLLFYLVGGLFASFAHIASAVLSAQITLVPSFMGDLEVPSVGASGAISAVLGAYLLLYPRARIRTLVFFIFIITIVRIPAFYYLGFWFLYQLILGLVSLTGLSSGVAFWAHIGGFVFGIVGMKAFDIKPRKKKLVIPTKRPVRPIVAPWVRTPLVDVLVEAERVIILAGLPGVEEKDITIDVSERTIVISAKHGDMKFHRQISLPISVSPRVENLIYRNGVLRFTLRTP